MKIKALLFTLFVGFTMISCSVGPTMKLADGSIYTLGGSAMSKSKNDLRSMTTPHGEMKWVRQNSDETQVPKMAIGMIGTVAAINGAADAVNSNNALEATKSSNVLKGVENTNATKQAINESNNALTLGVEALKAPK